MEKQDRYLSIDELLLFLLHLGVSSAHGAPLEF